MVEVTVDGKKVNGGKFKGFIKKRVIKFKAGRTQEAQLAKIEAKKKVLQARQDLLKQRTNISVQRAELRKQQLRSGGLNLPKFASSARDLGEFATGGVGGIGAGFSAIAGTPRQAPTPRTLRTVTRNVRIKSGKRKGKFRKVTKRISAAVSQPKAFDPFNQFQGGI